MRQRWLRWSGEYELARRRPHSSAHELTHTAQRVGENWLDAAGLDVQSGEKIVGERVEEAARVCAVVQQSVCVGVLATVQRNRVDAFELKHGKVHRNAHVSQREGGHDRGASDSAAIPCRSDEYTKDREVKRKRNLDLVPQDESAEESAEKSQEFPSL